MDTWLPSRHFTVLKTIRLLQELKSHIPLKCNYLSLCIAVSVMYLYEDSLHTGIYVQTMFSDLSIVEHRVFFHELLSLCEAEDAVLNKLPCYKSVSNLVPLRKSALRALAACHYIQSCREKIFPVLYKALEQSNPELQEAGCECMKKFISGFQIDMEMVSTQNLKEKQ